MHTYIRWHLLPDEVALVIRKFAIAYLAGRIGIGLLCVCLGGDISVDKRVE